MEKTLCFAAKTVERVAIGQENVLMKPSVLPVYCVVRTLMTRSLVLRKYALSAIRLDILQLTAWKLISSNAIDVV